MEAFRKPLFLKREAGVFILVLMRSGIIQKQDGKYDAKQLLE
jgi:hypothetical protein